RRPRRADRGFGRFRAGIFRTGRGRFDHQAAAAGSAAAGGGFVAAQHSHVRAGRRICGGGFASGGVYARAPTWAGGCRRYPGSDLPGILHREVMFNYSFVRSFLGKLACAERGIIEPETSAVSRETLIVMKI